MKKEFFKNISLILISCTVFLACDDKKRNPETNVVSQEKENLVSVPEFNADSAYYFIEHQVAFGPRVPNSKAHLNAGAYFEETLKKYGASVTVQEFEDRAYDGTLLYLKNIIASFNPEAKKRILLAAHWDTRPFADKDQVNKEKPIDGANDGGSGVGVLLEIARVLGQDKGLEIGVDIILFDGEDYGPHQDSGKHGEKWWCLGSQYWSNNKHKANYSAYYGILLDMVGGKNARFLKESYSLHYAPSIVKKVWDKAHHLGYGSYFINRESGEITDDHYFVNKIAKIPMIDIIDYDDHTFFGSYHHTHKDNLDIIDRATLKAVGETVLNVIYHE